VNVDRWQLVEELYHAASRLPAPQRDRFLDDSCGGDGALRAEVESLLTYQTSADTFIETPALDVAARLIASGDAHRRVAERQDNRRFSRVGEAW
jgi:hypothetical protein